MPVPVSDGLWVDNSVDAGEFRKALGSSLVIPGDSTGLVPRAGRLAGPGSPLAVTPTVPASMAVRVNAGKAHTFRSATYGGTLGVGPDGLATVPIPAAPASGSQWHRVYLLQRDTNAPASDATAGAVIDVASGVAAGSPTAPVLPAGALLLADVVIPAGALTVLAAHITDRPTYTAPRGGVLPVASQAERVALTTAGLVYPTLEVLELDTGRRLWHDGTRFRYEGDRVIVTDTTARDALTAYAGLRAVAPSTGNEWMHDGAAWNVPLARARIYATATGGVAAAGAWLGVTLTGTAIDTHNGANQPGAVGAWKVPAGQAGTYLVDGAIHYTGVGAGSSFAVRISVNNAAPDLGDAGTQLSNMSSGVGVAVAGSKLLTLAVGDVVGIQAYGGTVWQPITGNAVDGSASYLSLVRVS